MVKNLPACRRLGIDSWVKKLPWRMECLSTPVFLPGEIQQLEKPGGLQSMELQKIGRD